MDFLVTWDRISGTSEYNKSFEEKFSWSLENKTIMSWKQIRLCMENGGGKNKFKSCPTFWTSSNARHAPQPQKNWERQNAPSYFAKVNTYKYGKFVCSVVGLHYKCALLLTYIPVCFLSIQLFRVHSNICLPFILSAEILKRIIYNQHK